METERLLELAVVIGMSNLSSPRNNHPCSLMNRADSPHCQVDSPSLRLTAPPVHSYPNIMTIPGGFGATLIGGLVSAMLYGITTLQGLTCITCTTLRMTRPQSLLLLLYGFWIPYMSRSCVICCTIT
ncbi:hypothetical protein EDD17DRAFT_1047544 [Pisolithus thermaeus]|nr:hypothetical protein EDD17DRAFT_1047544 [Pisolithus thermaeus]